MGVVIVIKLFESGKTLFKKNIFEERNFKTMLDYKEYQKWEGHIAVPIAECYNLLVKENKVTPDQVSLNFTLYLYEIYDRANLNGKEDVETIKSKIFVMQGKTFRELYSEEINLMDYCDDIMNIFSKYNLLG